MPIYEVILFYYYKFLAKSHVLSVFYMKDMLYKYEIQYGTNLITMEIG